MKNLFAQQHVDEILTRLERLTPASTRNWGKMNVAQMLSHCHAALEVATDQKFPPRIFMGRILGPFLKASMYNEKPFGQNYPTDKTFIRNDQRDFETEKAQLIRIIRQFAQGGILRCTRQPHSFFGALTPEQWSISMYKHLDHHLRQFGV